MAHDSGQRQEGHEEHGHGGHEKADAGAWIAKNLGGATMAFGARMETVFEESMFLFVNGIAKMMGIAFLAIITPVILLELVLHTLRF